MKEKHSQKEKEETNLLSSLLPSLPSFLLSPQVLPGFEVGSKRQRDSSLRSSILTVPLAPGSPPSIRASAMTVPSAWNLLPSEDRMVVVVVGVPSLQSVSSGSPSRPHRGLP